MDIRNTPLEPGKYFHIFNRGINGCKVFFEEKNYAYFLNQYFKYTSPYVETYTYCLLGNHYHFFIKVRNERALLESIKKNKEKPLNWHVSNGFSSFLQSYTRAVNKMYSRTGPLFESPFKRIEVAEESYFSNIIKYIHKNPEKHNIVKDFREYPYSSYSTLISSLPTKLNRNDVLKWFGGVEAFKSFHEMKESKIEGSRFSLE